MFHQEKLTSEHAHGLVAALTNFAQTKMQL